MNKKELTQLLELSYKTPKQIKKNNVSLYKKLESNAGLAAETRIQKMLVGGSDELKTKLKGFKVGVSSAKDISALKDLVDYLEKSNASKAIIKEAEEIFRNTNLPDNTVELLQPNKPIKENPLFRKQLRAAEDFKIASIADITDKKLEKIQKLNGGISSLVNRDFDVLIKNKTLNKNEGVKIGLTVSLVRLLDKNYDLVKHVLKSDFDSIKGKRLTSIENIVELSIDDWMDITKSPKIILPVNTTAKTYAEILKLKIEKIFPNESLFLEILKFGDAPINNSLKHLKPLFDKNNNVFEGKIIEDLNIKGINKQELKKVNENYDVVNRVVKLFPGFEFGKLFNDRNISNKKKEEQVRQDVAYLGKFYTNNKNINILSLRLMPDSEDYNKIRLTGIPKKKQTTIIKTLKAYQRTYKVTKNINDLMVLMSSGYCSASEVTDSTFKQFVNKSGLTERKAKKYYKTSQSTVASAAAVTSAVVDIKTGGYEQLQVASMPPMMDDYLKKIDGYQALFGSQNYCKCEHCQSVLSPAAYYVDLLDFIEENILDDIFSGGNINHVLSLKVRRPDLWKLPLTCENTHGFTPYLKIINEILENYIATRINYTDDLYNLDGTPIDTRLDIEDYVYGKLLAIEYQGHVANLDFYKSITTFKQPFVLPVTELHTYIDHFKDKTSQVQIARLLDESTDVIARSALKCSLMDQNLITKQNTILDFHKSIYNYDFIPVGAGEIEKVDVQLLLRSMGLNRKEFGELIATKFVTDNGNYSVRINSEKIDENSFQNDIENIYGLRLSNLDRMHRFTRLYRKIEWTINELDLVIFYLEKNTLSQGIDETNTLFLISELLRINEAIKLPVDELIGLWSSELPQYSINDHTESLFNRLFNIKHFIDEDPEGYYPQNTTSFIHPAFLAETVATLTPNNHLERLLAALQIDAEMLYQLIIHLSTPLNLGADNSFILSKTNLSLLYKHALIARIIDATIPELFQMISHANTISTVYIENLSDLIALLEFNNWFQNNIPDWLSTSQSKLDDFGYVIDGVVQDASSFKDPTVVAKDIVSEVIKNNSLTFADTIFSYHEDITEEQSAIIISSNPTVFTKVGEHYRLSDTYYPTDVLIIPFNRSVNIGAEVITLPVLKTTCIEGEPSGEVDIIVANIAGFSGGDQIKIILDDDSVHVSTVSVAPSINTITITDPIPAGREINIDAELSKLPLSATTCAEQKPSGESNIVVADIAGFNDGDLISIALDDGSVHTTTVKGLPAGNTIILSDCIPFVEENIIRSQYIRPYHPIEIIPNYLSRHLDIPKKNILVLISMLNEDFTDVKYAQELFDDNLTPVKLADLVNKLLPLSVIFNDKKLTNASLQYINNNPSVFNIPVTASGQGEFTNLNTSVVKSLALYRRFVKTYNDETTNESVLIDVLNTFDVTTSLFNATNDKDKENLSEMIGLEWGVANILQYSVNLPGAPLAALNKLQDTAEISSYLGVSGEILKLIVSDDYVELNLASRAVLSAFRAKYTDEMEWQDKIEPFENKIREMKRDALTDYLTHKIHPEFTNANDLYHHFLIDTELNGCAKTSRVVAAISSLQLYVHRVIMNLEQDNKAPSDPHKIQVLFNDPDARKEWSWRKNYRVFEANRRVFLTPENWIEPDLRDNKTPLFEELESELLQQDINSQNVLDAYTKYMRGFEEVANLEIAGTYHDVKEGDTDILHIIGVTKTQPYMFYYRNVKNAILGRQEENVTPVYNSWKKIDVQIPVKIVSPIVFKNRLYVFWITYTTQQKNKVETGNSTFTGYHHKMTLEYTMLRIDGEWTPPQKVKLLSIPSVLFHNGEGIIDDLLLYGTDSPKYDRDGIHLEPKDGYTLGGFQFDTAYLHNHRDLGLSVTSNNYALNHEIDLYKNEIKVNSNSTTVGLNNVNWSKVLHYSNTDSDDIFSLSQNDQAISLYSTTHGIISPYARCSITSKWSNLEEMNLWAHSPSDDIVPMMNGVLDSLKIISGVNHIELKLINGSLNDCLIEKNDDVFYLQGSVNLESDHYILSRLGTTLSHKLSNTLITKGIDSLLDTTYQNSLGEKHIPFNFLLSQGNPSLDLVSEGELDFKGSYGIYYREIFFHIPFLIANHLNSQSKYFEAQKWYHYIFDPTSSETISADSSLTLEEQVNAQKKRNWRYLEFRELPDKPFRDQILDEAAISEYKANPFSPHAIARLRPSAYQKTIVMKYIDNLLDWGDHLFSQDTMESINEATLLYILASDILGERPEELGDCGEGKLRPKNYEAIKPLLRSDNEFLIEMEYEVIQNEKPNSGSITISDVFALDSGIVESVARETEYEFSDTTISRGIFRGVEKSKASTSHWLKESIGVAYESDSDVDSEERYELTNVLTEYERPELVPVGPNVIKQTSPVFCLPGNKLLLKYWDRVEDRLHKIRNCMNISGQRRQLSLFAPPIDPGMMVRARAAGLSIEDVMNSISGDLPPYRFTYLIEKAKSYAGTLQGFGSSLLSALEKKDTEELNRLRVLHEQNVMKMNSEIRKKEIDAAEESIQALKSRKAVIEERKKYYSGLIESGLNAWEVIQGLSIHTSSVLNGVAGILNTVGAIAYLAPQVGSPFAMKYGGKDIGDSGTTWSEVLQSAAQVSNAIAASAGFEAGNQRREEGWEHQKTLADKEILDIDKQTEAAKIRKDIAKISKIIHEETISQTQETYEFYGEKFTNIGLYTWLSTNLQRLFREAYNCTYGMARLAEQAYRFERSDDTSQLLETNYWEASKVGLMAGEKLMLDLLNLDKRYIETNYRNLEINQSFSLTQIAPSALINLKESGECTFKIDEIFYDLSYPGQYRRKVKAVRISIPSVTGPYTNVSATLSLLGSEIRLEPDASIPLKTVPNLRTTNIAASTAQNDSGVFELNFRDERLMPFEGAGAISEWKLLLPKSFRQFDYQTISDVIIHVSYTAEYDDAFRDELELKLNGQDALITSYLKTNKLSRVFSIKQEFSHEFHDLLHNPVSTPITFEIEDKHFPIFLKGKSLKAGKSKMILVVKEPSIIGNVDIGIQIEGSTNSTDINTFSQVSKLSDLPVASLDTLFSNKILGKYIIKINDAGNLSPINPSTANVTVLDDILIQVEYGLASTS